MSFGDPCGHGAFLNGLTGIIDNPQCSHRLQDIVMDILSEYKNTVKRLKSIEQQLGTFIDTGESGKILLSILDIDVINASAFLAAIDEGQCIT